MSFAGIPAAALVPIAAISNIKGEKAVSYDALSRVAFKTSSGTVYTPDRVDTLIIALAQNPLGALVVGASLPANADVGVLTTAIPVADESGLPTNFGPGRGKWASDPTGQFRLRVSADETLTVVAVAAGAGSVVSSPSLPGADAKATVRNFHGEQLDTLILTVECVHSVQG